MMAKQKNQQNYSTYLKAISATLFTVGTFLFAKSTGYLFGSSDLGGDNKENIETEKNKVDLRRSIDQAINQETPQSLQLINSTPPGKFIVHNLQDMISKNNTARVDARNDGFKETNHNNLIN